MNAHETAIAQVKNIINQYEEGAIFDAEATAAIVNKCVIAWEAEPNRQAEIMAAFDEPLKG